MRSVCRTGTKNAMLTLPLAILMLGITSTVFAAEGTEIWIPVSVLVLEFSRVVAFPGESNSGRKSVTVLGELREYGKVTASFEASRRTMGSILAPWGEGTCSMLNKCALTLANDIAKWLKDPTMDAKLGESR
jgi:hypothetical protein